jgi:hypothetical protein
VFLETKVIETKVICWRAFLMMFIGTETLVINQRADAHQYGLNSSAVASSGADCAALLHPAGNGWAHCRNPFAGMLSS